MSGVPDKVMIEGEFIRFDYLLLDGLTSLRIKREGILDFV